MRRIRLNLEYDGTAYAGWQRQENALAVQEVLEKALHRLTKEEIRVTGASRTDAGVHALCQVCAFDTASRIPAEKFSYALNTLLPDDIRVRESLEADSDFHPRFQAHGKIYRYQIYNSPHASALLRHTHAHFMYPLDESLMDREAQAIVGTHDFAPFAASGSVVKDTVRTMYRVRVFRHEQEVTLLVYGGGFLYNMVRILAGTLMQVGCGKLPEGAIARALASGSRLDLGVTAPAHGLTLLRVFYPGEEEEARELFAQSAGPTATCCRAFY